MLSKCEGYPSRAVMAQYSAILTTNFASFVAPPDRSPRTVQNTAWLPPKPERPSLIRTNLCLPAWIRKKTPATAPAQVLQRVSHCPPCLLPSGRFWGLPDLHCVTSHLQHFQSCQLSSLAGRPHSPQCTIRHRNTSDLAFYVLFSAPRTH